MPTRDAIRWFKGHFKAKIDEAVSGTPFTSDLITAIACQETGYLWNTLRRHMPVERVLELCVGDTIDFTPPNKGRKAFPKNKAELFDHSHGHEMFDIGRNALIAMAEYITDYRGAAGNPVKFCRGYGIFQYDLQHFKTNPDFFLKKQWSDFDRCLTLCLKELKAAQSRAGLQQKSLLTDLELCHVSIAYNRGSFNPSNGLQQGYKSGGKYYGEYIYSFLNLSKDTPTPGEPPAVIPSPPQGVTVLPLPTPIEAAGKTFLVDVTTYPLRMRSTPEIRKDNPTHNVIARLPAGQLVRAVADKKVGEFIEVETSLRGAFYRGWVAAKHLVETTRKEPIKPSDPLPPEVKPPVPAVYAPRRSGAITRRRDPATAHSLNEPGQPKRQGTTPAQLCDDLHKIIRWLDVENPEHSRYKPANSLTFCNIYAHDYCHLANIYLPRVWWTGSAILRLSRGESVNPHLNATIEEQRANSLFGWLRDFGNDFGWRQTGTLTKLQEAANHGAVCLIIARRHSDGPPGHVTIVLPETENHKARRSTKGDVTAPLQSQAGSRNFCFSTYISNWWLNDRFAESAFWIHS